MLRLVWHILRDERSHISAAMSIPQGKIKAGALDLDLETRQLSFGYDVSIVIEHPGKDAASERAPAPPSIGFNPNLAALNNSARLYFSYSGWSVRGEGSMRWRCYFLQFVPATCFIITKPAQMVGRSGQEPSPVFKAIARATRGSRCPPGRASARRLPTRASHGGTSGATGTDRGPRSGSPWSPRSAVRPRAR